MFEYSPVGWWIRNCLPDCGTTCATDSVVNAVSSVELGNRVVWEGREAIQRAIQDVQ